MKNTLLKEGYIFNSNSDTEVLLVSYIHWGEKCIHKFNGMWAFAIYDMHSKNIFLSRDRIGKKPLFYIELIIVVFPGVYETFKKIIFSLKIITDVITSLFTNKRLDLLFFYKQHI